MTRRSSAPRPPRARWRTASTCSGKVALVTGGSSGLGQETARVLAERGAHVILTARDMPKGEAVAAAIRASTGNQQVEVEELELGSLKQIRAFARTLPGAPPDAAHPRQQRRRHGMPAGEDRGRPRAPVRLEPRRPLPDDLPARAGAASRARRAAWSRSARAAITCPRSSSTTSSSSAGRTTSGSPTARRRRPTCSSRSASIDGSGRAACTPMPCIPAAS